MNTIKETIREERNYLVVKANEVIRKARYDLSLTELKTLAYVLSKVKPGDPAETEYTFSITDYCRVCGIEANSGKNYAAVKAALKGLRDKSIWVKDEKGRDKTMGWLGYVTLDPGNGTAIVELDKRMQKYIIGLFKDFTQYELISVLPMRSAYSVRMYEMLKSYAHLKEHAFDIDDLKKQLFAEMYVNFKDFRKRVLEPAVKEINLYTDIEVSWEPVKYGRKVTDIKFSIRMRDPLEAAYSYAAANDQLDGQMNFNDYPEILPKEP